MRSSNEIREAFLDYFRRNGHQVVPSSSLVPGADATLLFTNSGMVQFKDVFLGAEQRPYTRATSSQRCVRAGGKHNDLDQVGYTARHHTFFEMLGNFSFGDYFKREAIRHAWELLTGVYGLPATKLWVTVYHTDDEAYGIWADEIGVPRERIVRIDDNKGAPYASDNFWQMADTGPCGPCSEIFYDHGPEVAGGPPGSPDADGDRYIEIWNLVFMQFDRAADGTLSPLPKPCVDTGMGLERLAAVLQHVHSNYDIDLFRSLIASASRLTGTSDLANQSLRVIADHIRACSFLIADGVLPSNEGRGYVVRRIIRRALRHGWMLGTREPFFHRMIESLIGEMGAAYPELVRERRTIEAALKAEEERFAETLDQGMRVFEDVASRAQGTIAGDDAFRLYDTYGFPVDLTADIARERGLSVDLEGFEKAMDVQRARARAASQFGGGVQVPAELAASLPATRFTGYDALEFTGARVLAILGEDGSRDGLADGDSGVVILDQTPFYAESGGQVGDRGGFVHANGRFEVVDTQKLAGAFHGHVGVWSGSRLSVGDLVSGQVDHTRRSATVLNHSATHLLHAALRRVLGTHVSQKGSLVSPDRLRFDFAHFQPVGAQELVEIERLVNAEVRGNADAEVQLMGFQQAIEFGAMALFGEKYGDEVRVLRFGEFSTELCGGTHVGRTGDIGLFRIVSESGVAAGVRRIEAVTGQGALDHVMERERRLHEAESLLGAHGPDVVDRLRAMFERQRRLERELESLKAKAASGALDGLLAQAVTVGAIHVVTGRLDGVDAKGLREAVDLAKQRLGDAVVVLATGADGKVSLIAGVSGAALGAVKAGDVLAHVARQIGGKGGGRPDLAQGGGEDSPRVAEVLAGVAPWVAERAGAA
jgi:alanyl-tRNA synthetase